MKDYTIYCTLEQTKKALELGAPIELKKHTYFDYKGSPNSYYDGEICPTADQMIGWLEEQTIFVIIEYVNNDKTWFYRIINSEDNYKNKYRDFSSRKEAIISAIDEALEYLTKNKK